MLLPGDRAASEGGEERMERKQKRRGHTAHASPSPEMRRAARRYHCISSSRSMRKQQNTTRRCSGCCSLLPASPTAANGADVNKGERDDSSPRSRAHSTAKAVQCSESYGGAQGRWLRRGRRKIVPRFNNVRGWQFSPFLLKLKIKPHGLTKAPAYRAVRAE